MKRWKFLIRKEKRSYAEVANIYDKNESSICEIERNERETHASFAVAPQTVKVTATVSGGKYKKEYVNVCISQSRCPM